MSDPQCIHPETIFLEPPCSAGDEGALWAADDPFDPCEGCGNTATKYIRADVVDAELSRLRASNKALGTALVNYMNEFPAFRTTKPEGAPNSPARKLQERRIGLEDMARAALAKAGEP